MSLLIVETLPGALAPDTALASIDHGAPELRIAFPAFSDGRGFSLAAALRRAGFTGRLIASGALIPDQYRMARRAGFDAVEVSTDTARRCDWEGWLQRNPLPAESYQSRLRAFA
ncbi:MAG: DUF934 domain-containing protein [Paracoccaceae bacterium]|jgi:uncharacterized protein (DUF934 family)